MTTAVRVDAAELELDEIEQHLAAIGCTRASTGARSSAGSIAAA